MRTRTVLLSTLLSTALAACGGDDDGVAVVDAPPGIDAPADIDAAPLPCTISTPSFGDKGALTANATFAADPNNAAIYKIAVTGPLEGAEPTDLFFLELFTGYAPFGTEAAPTAVVPGTYQLTGDQLNYATCGVCVTLASNATAQGWEDDFMATGGTVTIAAVGDAVGETFTATFSNLTFEQVTIDANTSESTPVGNNCTTAITNATFTGTVAAPQMKASGAAAPARARKALRAVR